MKIPCIALMSICIAAIYCTTANGQVDVQELTIANIHERYRAGDLTCESLVREYVDRIARLDQSTSLNSIVVVNPNALKRAKELDEEFKQTGQLRPLHGIPVVVKDNYDTADLQTAAGSLALKGSLPPDDAFQVRRLREAGAIVLCKSNMAEWAYSPWFTVSSIAGTTSNPYDLTRVPAGSSGGTAAAIAANLGAVGLGTDTGNSIRGPSSHCCLVGIRPTLGLVSRDGIVPLFLRNDAGGPMCRTVEDCARILDVIAGHDTADPVTGLCQNQDVGGYFQGLGQATLEGVRIGVFRTLSDQESADDEFCELFEQAIRDLAEHGAEIIDPFEIRGFDNIQKLNEFQNRLWIDTFRHDIGEYLATLGDKAPIKSLDDILNSREFDPFLKSRLDASAGSRVPSRLARPYSADPAEDENRARLLRAVEAAMDKNQIDIFVFPTWNNPPRNHDDLNSPDGNNSYHIPPATGQPAITVPMGFDSRGLPAGLQMVARRFAERKLLQIAYAYEKATRHRRPPKGLLGQ